MRTSCVKKLFEEKRRHINTTSDSEILLNIFASELDNFRHYPLEADNIFAAIAATNRLIRGAYACVAMIIGMAWWPSATLTAFVRWCWVNVTLATVAPSIWWPRRAWPLIRLVLNSCAMSRRAKRSILPRKPALYPSVCR
ncbi:Amidophosphoribosyltransferase [Klebsiella pneumoniae]|uniref:Amidophosphoribosyltransferase n=1 Tax=Klebsiella pneumoniae TaxID=573 RepID=A0A378C0D4_KLEPN|nr:Amidophosphoribosyltransferase [Klebsiella pneumoniae]